MQGKPQGLLSNIIKAHTPEYAENGDRLCMCFFIPRHICLPEPAVYRSSRRFIALNIALTEALVILELTPTP